jgi:hypothetical protein
MQEILKGAYKPLRSQLQHIMGMLIGRPLAAILAFILHTLATPALQKLSTKGFT